MILPKTKWPPDIKDKSTWTYTTTTVRTYKVDKDKAIKRVIEQWNKYVRLPWYKFAEKKRLRASINWQIDDLESLYET